MYMNKNKTQKIIMSAVIALVMTTLPKTTVYAGCEQNYGGGETCLINKRFEIEKEVRVCKDGDSDSCDDWGSWEDKVTDVKKGQLIQFRIKVTNLSDDEADEFDDMRVEDFMPNELYRVGGSGLTEYWDNFASDEEKEFKIEVLIDEDEFDRENFEKCIVNKAEVEWDGEFEGSDTATVCYNDDVKGEITELPETGGTSVAFVAGLLSLTSGLVLRKKFSLS